MLDYLSAPLCVHACMSFVKQLAWLVCFVAIGLRVCVYESVCLVMLVREGPCLLVA